MKSIKTEKKQGLKDKLRDIKKGLVKIVCFIGRLNFLVEHLV